MFLAMNNEISLETCMSVTDTYIDCNIFCKEHNKSLFVGILDNAKAFDYANRPQISDNLIDRGCGTNFVRVVANVCMLNHYMLQTSAVANVCMLNH